MGFLSPWFLLGTLAVGVPLWVHLIRREQAVRLPFSSLMFLRRVPIKSGFPPPARTNFFFFFFFFSSFCFVFVCVWVGARASPPPPPPPPPRGGGGGGGGGKDKNIFPPRGGDPRL